MVSGQLFNRVVIIPLSPHTPSPHPHPQAFVQRLIALCLLRTNDPICTIHTVWFILSISLTYNFQKHSFHMPRIEITNQSFTLLLAEHRFRLVGRLFFSFPVLSFLQIFFQFLSPLQDQHFCSAPLEKNVSIPCCCFVAAVLIYSVNSSEAIQTEWSFFTIRFLSY